MGRGNTSGVATSLGSSSSLIFPTGSDQSAELQSALDAVENGEFGMAALAPGTFLAADLEIRSRMAIGAAVHGATTIKLPDGANTDLLVTEGFSGLTGGTTRGGPEDFAIRGITLDGNRDNNSSGWPLKIFGSSYVLEDVEIQHGSEGGLKSEWGTGGTDMRADIRVVMVHDNDGDGIDWGGPHDSQFLGVEVFKNGADGIKTGGNATSEVFTGCHSWGTEQDWAWRLNSTAFLNGCEGEGATLGQLMIGGGGSQILGGSYFGTGVGVETGIQIGDASNLSISSVGVYGVYLKGFSATGVPINFYSSGGGNVFLVTMDPAEPTITVVGGSPAASDEYRIRSSVTSIAAQSRMRQYGTMTIDAPGSTPANTAFTIKNSAGNDRFNFNAATPKLEVNSGGQIVLYSGSYTGQTLSLDGDGFIDIAEVTAPAAPAADTARIYVDVSGVKSKLMVRFQSGASQQIAIEP